MADVAEPGDDGARCVHCGEAITHEAEFGWYHVLSGYERCDGEPLDDATT